MYRDNDGAGPFRPNDDLILKARRASSRLHLIMHNVIHQKSYQVPWQIVPDYEVPAKNEIPIWLPKIGANSQLAKAQQRQQSEKQQQCQETEWKRPILPRSALNPKKVLPPTVTAPAAPHTRVARLKQEDGVASHNLPPPCPPARHAKVARGKQETVPDRRQRATRWERGIMTASDTLPQQPPKVARPKKEEAVAVPVDSLQEKPQTATSREQSKGWHWVAAADCSQLSQPQQPQDPAFGQHWHWVTPADHHQSFHPQQQFQPTINENWQRIMPEKYQVPPIQQPQHASQPQKTTRWKDAPVAPPPRRQPLMPFSGPPPPRQPSTKTAVAESPLSASVGKTRKPAIIDSPLSSSVWNHTKPPVIESPLSASVGKKPRSSTSTTESWSLNSFPKTTTTRNTKTKASSAAAPVRKTSTKANKTNKVAKPTKRGTKRQAAIAGDAREELARMASARAGRAKRARAER
ncbi:hypothetical protein QBC44DRAFT_96775 [Cladorrhinum sp. PSN332]|nr:hypothetical protein QBC44DRAFT_96775 [Cladorrhinum sp. PSN332]